MFSMSLYLCLPMDNLSQEFLVDVLRRKAEEMSREQLIELVTIIYRSKLASEAMLKQELNRRITG